LLNTHEKELGSSVITENGSEKDRAMMTNTIRHRRQANKRYSNSGHIIILRVSSASRQDECTTIPVFKRSVNPRFASPSAPSAQEYSCTLVKSGNHTQNTHQSIPPLIAFLPSTDLADKRTCSVPSIYRRDIEGGPHHSPTSAISKVAIEASNSSRSPQGNPKSQVRNSVRTLWV
jgi:hypothetical protein